MTRIVVVGAGIAGLAAARGLAEAGRVTVLEASPRCGGKLAALELDGVRLDAGAESMLVRRPEALDLAAALGLSVVHPSPAQPSVLLDGSPVPLPPSLLGVPSDVEALSTLLTPPALERARAEPTLPAPGLSGDVAIGVLVDDRFGPQVTDRLLEPLLGGVYAGRSRELSFAAVAPALFDRARAGGSLSGHASELQRSAASGPVFGGLANGVCGLVDGLLLDLARRGIEIRTGAVVRRLAPSGSGYLLACGRADRPERVAADAVVLAAPARPTGRLLSAVSPVGTEWAAIPYASTAVVTMVLRGGRLSGSGLLVPPGQSPTIKAVTHSAVKWPWVADVAAARWGPQAQVARVSVGRVGEESLLQLDDDELLRRTFAEATRLPGWRGTELITGAVSRWGGGLPQYRVGHRDLVDRLRAQLARHPGLAVCGAALDGVGLAACVGSATAAVEKIEADLGG